ncbi:unnamed protein product [Cyprideis torosa]|uniref:Uncharacterized protein n=1 Tax=Cyprideis torosa TaxID=163714 RepID=A0A7R8X3K7_9CRUS|nr:unnamed protein product [Cyprideis torosa]CAG0911391.1 unnamed protein product [Cyprideis torosa]
MSTVLTTIPDEVALESWSSNRGKCNKRLKEEEGPGPAASLPDKHPLLLGDQGHTPCKDEVL